MNRGLHNRSAYCLVLLALFACAAYAVSEESVPLDREQDLAFVAETDGSEQRYVLWQPKEVADLHGAGVVIALHGHGSDRWQFIQNPRDECRALRDMARKHRMAVIAPDYRAKTSWMGPAAEADLLQLLRHYRKEYAPNRVILVGGSMGAASALTFAALHPDTIQGVVAINGIANHVEYTGFQDAISASFGGDKQTRPEEYEKRSAELHPEGLSMPMAFTLGGADTVTPPDSVLRLADHLKRLGRESLVITRPEGGHETSYQDTCDAIEWVISKVYAL